MKPILDTAWVTKNQRLHTKPRDLKYDPIPHPFKLKGSVDKMHPKGVLLY